MSLKSSGILAYRLSKGFIEVLLVHPAPGPNFFPGDRGWWSIPKGQFTDETPLEAGLREFEEEVGVSIKSRKLLELTPVLQKNGKIVHAYAVEEDVDITLFKSNNFLYTNPETGEVEVYLEVDKAEWFDIKTAKIKLGTQRAFLDELLNKVNGSN